MIALMVALMAAPAAPALEEASVAELQKQLQSGALSARDLTAAYLQRIREIDPLLKSVLETNPDALEIAARLDEERKAKGPRGPLHGIPVLVKDNLATGDKMQTTAGSLALAGVHAKRDAFVVERLRAAGAIILGKTNLSEWANIRSNRSSSGWSGRGGQTRNPYALDRSPCGSSSGTGSAIAASLATVGVGTETDGSISCPSSSAGLVGLKPTVGLLSRSGIIPISHTQDTPGPMARSVADAAALLTAMTGVDADDPATAASKGHAAADYTQYLDANGLAGARIGVVRAPKAFGSFPAADRTLADALEVLKKQGAVIVDPAEIPHLGEYDDAELEIMLTELKADLPKWLEAYAPDAAIKSLADVIAFDKAHAESELQYFGQENFEKAQQKGGLEAADYKKAVELAGRLSRAEGIDAILKQHKLDALVAPSFGPAWTIDLVTGDHFNMGSSTPAAVAGYPAITVPAGAERGLPMGITFMGTAWSEGALIKFAYAYEQATHARKAPGYRPTVDLR